MFSYVSLGTADLSRALTFYDPALAPLGHARFKDYDSDGTSAACGRDDPGPQFYAAYVRDPDGNKLNAVCYLPGTPP